MAGYWPSSFFCVVMDRDVVEVHKLAKKRTRPISSHLDRTNLVNKGFIISLSGKCFLRDKAGSPERARWLHLARSGSQSHRAIWVILPARGASHIIISRYKVGTTELFLRNKRRKICKQFFNPLKPVSLVTARDEHLPSPPLKVCSRKRSLR